MKNWNFYLKEVKQRGCVTKIKTHDIKIDLYNADELITLS